MRKIPFTQYKLPHGQPVGTWIFMHDDVCELADAIMALGYRFEVELLTTGEVSMSIHDIAEELDVASELCRNAPGEIRFTVERMIRKYAQKSGAV